MRLEFEILYLVDGHLFDAESYEVTPRRLALTQREPGYYLLPRSDEGRQRRDDPSPELRGPFTSAERARLAMRELQARDAAIERTSAGLPAPAMASREDEVRP